MFIDKQDVGVAEKVDACLTKGCYNVNASGKATMQGDYTQLIMRVYHLGAPIAEGDGI